MSKRDRPDPSLTIIWDQKRGGNVEHLAEHGVTPEEFEQVLAARFHQREISQSHPQYWLCSGYTHASRFLLIVFEYVEDDHVVNPVTAYEPSRRPGR